MLNLRDALQHDIAAGIAAAQEAGDLPKLADVPAVVVERPDNPERGDYASPVALALTRLAKKAPFDIVVAIVKHMPKKEYVGKLEAVAPGFLNVRLHPGWMAARLDNVIEQDICDDIRLGEGKGANLEFISANPTGPLTLANCRPAFAADTLARVLECAGYNVTREYYINDAGEQVRKLGESVLRRILQAQGERLDYPPELYQGEYIREVGTVIVETLAENEGKRFTAEDLTDEAVVERVSREAAALLLGRIQQTIQDDLQVMFDVWTSERKLRESGVVDAIIEKLRQKKVVYKKDDVEYLKTTDFGDSEDRVLVKQDGHYAYIAPDIAYHQGKFDRNFDLIFTFVGADHQGHVPKLQAAMAALGNDITRLHFMVVQWFRLVRDGKPVKVSKRAGVIVTPHDLIHEVGYDAARFLLLQHGLNSPMDLDLSLAKEQNERNPVYYVQYAYVRLQSILRRAKEAGLIADTDAGAVLATDPIFTQAAEIDLLRAIYRFPEIISEIARSFEVQGLTVYARELAAVVHVFYKQAPVLAAGDETVVHNRLQLVLAGRTVLGRVLDLLGISKPDVM